MFGRTIDYWLLRPLAHDRHPETEELRRVESNLSAQSAKERFENGTAAWATKLPSIRPCATWMSGAA